MSTSTTTPSTAPPQPRSTSHSRTRTGTIPSRPTTPLRPPSRTSLRASQTTPTASGPIPQTDTNNILSTLEPAFSELSDGMADLEANMLHLQLLHESLSRFNETFGAFLYGMNMTAFCVDFPEAPIRQSFARQQEGDKGDWAAAVGGTTEATFLTSDTSFVNDPPPTGSVASSMVGGTERGRGTGAGRGVSRGASVGRGGAAATGRGRAGASGIARGAAGRGRGVR